MPEARHPTLRALALPDLRAFLAARFLSMTARSLLHAAIVWHLFDATRRELYLGVLGLVEFLPVIPVALVGGQLADTRDRRDVLVTARSAALAIAIALAAATGQAPVLPLLLGTAFALALVQGFEFPAGQALLPALVPRELFPSAVVVSATVRNLGFVGGPVLAGFAIASGGPRAAYATAAAGTALSLVALRFVRRAGPAGARTPVGLAPVREGLGFLRGRPVLLGAMGLDMVAVILADPTVLLAVFADEILAVGPQGYGLLRGAIGFGTLATTLLLLFRRSAGRPGAVLLASIFAFGSAAIVFGVSRSFPLSLAALVAAGMADQVSMVTRATILQLSTPDALRGRMNAVNMVFIGASNELGAAFSGFLAAATGVVFAVVAGGVGCCATTGLVALRFRELARYRIPAGDPGAYPSTGSE